MTTTQEINYHLDKLDNELRQLRAVLEELAAESTRQSGTGKAISAGAADSAPEVPPAPEVPRAVQCELPEQVFHRGRFYPIK